MLVSSNTAGSANVTSSSRVNNAGSNGSNNIISTDNTEKKGEVDSGSSSSTASGATKTVDKTEIRSSESTDRTTPTNSGGKNTTSASNDTKSNDTPELKAIDQNRGTPQTYKTETVYATAASSETVNLDTVVVWSPGQNIGGGMTAPERDMKDTSPVGIQIQIDAIQTWFRDNKKNLGQAMFGRDLTAQEEKKFQSDAFNAPDGRTMIGKIAYAVQQLAKTEAAMLRSAALLKETLTLREGRKNDVYLDSQGNLTVGIGHLVTDADGLKLGDHISDAQVDAFFDKDSGNALTNARRQMWDTGIMTSDWVAAIANVNFQFGNFPAKFPDTWKAITAGRYSDAIQNIQNSLWMKQTPVRANDFIAVLQNLQRVYKV